MKQIKYFLAFALMLLLTSCNFTENIDVHPDGSGNFSIEMDGAGLLAMAGDKLGNELGMKNNAKAIDSTFSFKEIFATKKDSIAKMSPEQQEALKKLESFVMKIKMNPEAKQLLFSMNTPFKSVNDLGGLMESMAAMKDLKGKSDKKDNPAAMMSGLGNNNAKLSFSYNGKNFSRKVIVLKDQIKKIAADSLGMAKMIFASSKYTLKYHFPKAVKSVSNPDALFSADRKTITVEYPFTDYSENPEKLNLNVVFE
ncbi:hypothetical protein SAMN05192550_1406 [Flavobacterium glycines]|uniref:Lipoprotein n=1 Tax=Flavobacterium glycines TaxID=551990 RepID=A0A1B9DWV6_9FLAO|nr:hypothetical protein [Flavobacterium glycines]OCB74166.1 hypothetical protein FBGL_03215 [Flavobacterium glycines]GEL09589.1 hypothetical protein FGL01_03280 [Flavobacterium glycines]SDJ01228.1 hypothetical protein SAMN05192550_1406 [Flavobacterium glycines]